MHGAIGGVSVVVVTGARYVPVRDRAI